jgi:PAS domain S-box-containing protein
MDAAPQPGLAQRYAELFEFAPDAYVVTDPYGSITEANRAAIELLRAGILPGKPLAVFVPLDQRRVFREKLNVLTADGGARQTWRGRLKPASGAELVIEFSVGGVPHPHGGLLRLCWLMRPVI